MTAEPESRRNGRTMRAARAAGQGRPSATGRLPVAPSCADLEVPTGQRAPRERRQPPGVTSAMRLFNRRNFLMSACAAVPGTWAYGRFIESDWLEVNRVRVPLPGRFPGGPVRILHASDFHLSGVVPLDFIRRAIAAGRAQSPHFACLTGDFVTGHVSGRAGYAAALRALSDTMPTYAVLGNHDGGEWAARHGGYEDTTEIAGLLAEARVELLQNRFIALEAAGQRLWLGGLGDLWSGSIFPALAYEGFAAAADEPVVLLSHNPDSKENVADRRWDLMLSGHTHGGQIGLFGLGRVFAPVRDKRYYQGLNAWGRRWLHVSRGVGNLLGIRIACRPQVTLVELVPAVSSAGAHSR
jgi:uncharacterized protein